MSDIAQHEWRRWWDGVGTFSFTSPFSTGGEIMSRVMVSFYHTVSPFGEIGAEQEGGGA